MNRTWARLLLTSLLLGGVLQACNCGTKQKAKTTSGIVVVSVDGHDVTEDDTALPFAEACVSSPDVPPVTRSFHLKNSGTNALALKSMTITGANATSFKITAPDPLPSSVAPGGDVQVDLQFAPTQQGNVSATVVIETDDPNKGTVNVHLTGTGASKAPQPTYSLACNDPNYPDTCQTLSFPDTAVGASATASVTIKNDGCPPLQITGVEIDPFVGTFPDGGSSFVIHGTPPSAANPIVIQTGATYDLQLDFAPTDALNQALADLFVTTNGVPGTGQHPFYPLADGGSLPDAIFHVSLAGQGAAAQVTLTPGSCDFSQTDGGSACQATLQQSGDVVGHFLLANSGNAPVDVSSVAIPADDAGVFTIALPNSAPFTLDASGGTNAQVPFTVTYHPFNGNVVEDLTVVTSVGTFSSHLVAGNPAVISVPSTLDFNDSTINPPAQTLTVQDLGTGALVVQQPSFTQDNVIDGGQQDCSFLDGSGAAHPRFTIDSPTTWPQTIAALGSADWTVSHHRDPSIGGSVLCTLHLPNNDPGQPDAIVTVTAETPVNCDPHATFVPSGSLVAAASVDGGVYLIDGSGSYDTSDSTPVRCPNGQDDGLQLFHWTLTAPPGTPAFQTHLEPLLSGASTCAASNDAGCTDLTVSTGSSLYAPGDAAKVNLVAAGTDPQIQLTLQLTVTDGTGRTNPSSDTLTVSPQP